MLTGRLCVWVAASNEKESLFPDFSLLLAFIWPGPLLCLPHLPWPLISHPFLAPLLLPYMWLVPTSEPLHVLFAPRGTLLLSPHLPKSSTSGSLGISLGRPALAPCALKPQGKTPRALSLTIPSFVFSAAEPHSKMLSRCLFFGRKKLQEKNYRTSRDNVHA